MKNVRGLDMVEMDFSYSEKYWPLVSTTARRQMNKPVVEDAETVQEVLKSCFKVLEGEFLRLLGKQHLAIFFLFAHRLHENSIQLWTAQLKGKTLPINENDFSVVRRGLKIILEQSCALNLKGCPIFAEQIFENQKVYEKTLQELLYLTYQSILLSDFIARSQLAPFSILLRIIDGSLNVEVEKSHDKIFKFIETDIPLHNNQVIICNNFNDFKTIWKKELGLDFEILSAIATSERVYENPFLVIRKQAQLELFVKEFGYNEESLDDFYNGLTVNRDCLLPFEFCISRNQDVKRFTYRPILEMEIDNEYYWLIGFHKWSESLTTLSTNALPFGVVPEEWKKHKPIQKFVQHLEATHDKILEEPAIKLLKDRHVLNEWGITSIKTKDPISGKRTDNLNLEKLGVGDIDILFIRPEQRTIYVCECKHNRSRHDWSGWRRDYSSFKAKYEEQLDRKVKWVEENKTLVLGHFEIENEIEIEGKTEFLVTGLFVINAPTVYQYNCSYPTLTLYNFEQLLDNTFFDPKIWVTDSRGMKLQISRPYFDNLNLLRSEDNVDG